MPFLIALSIALAIVLLAVWAAWRRARRAEYIRQFALPPGLFERLCKRRPELGRKECQLVARGLRQFFLAYLMGGRRPVAMPSQLADDLWHEFILYTKAYEAFCARAFGRFLHHSPAIVLGSDRSGNEGLRRVWWYACREENIDPRNPTRLPLLFALDGKFEIADGFRYAVRCQDSASGTYCVADFSSTGFDGGTDGLGDGAGGDGGCGGGCGGD